MTPKAFDVLRYMVEHPGRLVTPDEMLDAIWSDTYVNPEVLRKYILEIRKALGDKPDTPQFVETIPKRGYRFIASVVDECTVAQTEVLTNGTALTSGIQTQKAESVKSHEQPKPAAVVALSLRHHKPWRIAILIAVLLLSVLILSTIRRPVRAARLTDKDTLVLADFANNTGDTIFDGTLRQGLSAQLEQSPFLNLLSDRRIAQTLSLMAQPNETALTGKFAGEVCQRSASAAVVEGSISMLGTQYVLGLKAADCRSGDVLDDEQETAKDKDHVLVALGMAASKMRRKLGESLSSVEKYDVPLEKVTTRSLDALKAYTLGMQLKMRQSDDQAAIPFLQHAISLDPGFAMAYAALGTSYSNLDQMEHARDYTLKAYNLRDQVSERERLFIEARYEQNVLGNLEVARKTCELWAQTYPYDEVAQTNLVVIYEQLGDQEKRLSLSRGALKSNPASGNAYGNLAGGYLNLSRFDDAKAIALEAQHHNLDSSRIHRILYIVAFAQRDWATADQEANYLADKPGYENLMIDERSQAAAFVGQFAKARTLSNRLSRSLGVGLHRTPLIFNLTCCLERVFSEFPDIC